MRTPRLIGMRRGLVATAAVLMMVTACSGTGSSDSAGHASGAGVVGCADLVAWATVMSTTEVGDQLRIRVDIEDHVLPPRGKSQVTFNADSPRREVGAPTWEAAGRVLVVLSPVAPASYYTSVEGKRLVQDWQQAGSPRMSDDECADA